MSLDSAARRSMDSGRLSRRGVLRLAAAASGGLVATSLAARAAASEAQTPGSGGAALAASGPYSGLDDTIRAAMAEAGIPGVAIGVVHGDDEYIAGYGVNNVDYPLPVDGDTLFQIGSISKTFTMTATMRLVEQGRLDLDTPIRQYLPDLQLSDREATARVTMRHLLTHTSGLPADNFAAVGGGDDALARYVAEEVPREPLLLPLGLYISYSNIGFSLAGRVLEAIAGQLYEAVIRELLFEPLGMKRATFFASDAIVGATAAGHTVLDGTPHVQRPWALPRTANPAGGITVSVRELLHYARMWLRGGLAPDGTRLLSAATLTDIGTIHSRTPADLLYIGLAWALPEVGGLRCWLHDGGTFGQNSRCLIARERDFALCVLTNVPDGAAVLGAAMAWLMEHLLGVDTSPPPAPARLTLDAATLARYAGTYENPGEQRITLRVRDDGLELVAEPTDPVFGSIEPPLPPDPPKLLAFTTPDVVFVVDAPAARGAFVRDPDGSIAGFSWGARYNVRLA